MKKLNPRKMEAGVKLLLEGMGVDLTAPDYVDTPGRVARMYTELFTPPKNNMATFPAEHPGLVLLRNHRLFGVCPHHLLPFEMRMHIGYIPNKKVLGLSKLARVAEEHLTAPILQEQFTNVVAYDLFKRTEAKGAGVIISAEHGCMQCRGVKTTGDIVTSSMHGVFLLFEAPRAELLQLIGKI
jgi:GTP cyclohydrolase I